MKWTSIARITSGGGWKVERAMQIAADMLAQTAIDPVCSRLGATMATMGAAEARGYVRARAALIIHRSVDAHLARDPQLPRATRAQLVNLTSDRVVRLVLSDRSSRSCLALPACEAG